MRHRSTQTQSRRLSSRYREYAALNLLRDFNTLHDSVTDAGAFCGAGAGFGTVTTSESPASGKVAAFSSGTAIGPDTSTQIQTAIGSGVYDASGEAAAMAATGSCTSGQYARATTTSSLTKRRLPIRKHPVRRARFLRMVQQVGIFLEVIQAQPSPRSRARRFPRRRTGRLQTPASNSRRKTAHNSSVIRTCRTSGSANTYSCTTSLTSTPAAGDEILINVNTTRSAAPAAR